MYEDGCDEKDLYGLILILLGEKVVQHVFVSYAFLYDVGGIRSWVVPDYRILLFSGAGVAVLFLVAFWGMFKEKGWSLGLVTFPASFDVVGEFYV